MRRGTASRHQPARHRGEAPRGLSAVVSLTRRLERLVENQTRGNRAPCTNRARRSNIGQHCVGIFGERRNGLAPTRIRENILVIPDRIPTAMLVRNERPDRSKG